MPDRRATWADAQQPARPPVSPPRHPLQTEEPPTAPAGPDDFPDAPSGGAPDRRGVRS